MANSEPIFIHQKTATVTAPATRRIAPNAAVKRTLNPLHEAIASGKLPVIQELHLTEADHVGYQRLRQRYLADTASLPNLTFLGQYLRQLDSTTADLTTEERELAHKLQVYADLLSAGKIDMIALDDGPRGREALDNAIAAELLVGVGVEPTQLMANVVARNRQAEQIRQRLIHFANLGLRSVLLVTGDLPADNTKPARFPLDSIGMCALARDMIIEGSLPDDFLIAAAGHPNADADPDGMRTLQKALAGARVIITQVIHNVDSFRHWMDALQKLDVLDMVHVFAEMIPLTSSSQLRSISDIPGIRVPTELIEEFVTAESRIELTAQAGGHDDEWIKRQRLQHGAKVTRSMLQRIRHVPGVSGLYLGCVRSFSAHVELLKEMPLLQEQASSIQKVTRQAGLERQRVLAQLPVIEVYLERMLRAAKQRETSLLGKTLRRLARSVWLERILKMIEWPKVPAFGCKKCDRCDLSADALVCPRGCAKQMSHGPCGAPLSVNGRMLCEDTSRECTWAEIRHRRHAYGVPVCDLLETREAPSSGFYSGTVYSAVIPVLEGRKPGPNWSLMFRVPWVTMMRFFRRDYALVADGSAHNLSTLVAAKATRIRTMLDQSPDMDQEELLIKTLSLVGTPQAIHLIESRMVQIGLPAEGTFSELSIREQFLVAEALPNLRRRLANDRIPSVSPLLRCDEILAVVPEGTSLRRSLRRELANGTIRYVASLGVRVTYTDILLAPRNVEDFLKALTILKEELQLAPYRDEISAANLAVHFNRIHYKHHYRAPIAIRRYRGADDDTGHRTELVVDVRQFGTVDRFRANLREALQQVPHDGCECPDAIVFETFAGESQSVCWAFNDAFWKRLSDFEKATGINYDESIGGSTDRNKDYVRSTARAYFDRLHEQALTDEKFYIVEIGVASTQRASVFLDELQRISTMVGVDYYQRTTYVLADYSQDILQRGAAELMREHRNVESVCIDASNPAQALAPYSGRIMHVHICNVYDNLPTDKLAWVDRRVYGIEGRAYLSRAVMTALLSQHGFAVKDASELEARLVALTDNRDANIAALLDWARDRLVTLGYPPLNYVAFWMDLFKAIKVEERYVVLNGSRPSESSGVAALEDVDKLLRDILPMNRSVRVHLNQKAVEGFVELLNVLHPNGVLEVVDLFVQRIEQYYQAFKGPAKYDGSTVNWLNGPLFREVGEQLGYQVRFHAFKPFSAKSASVIMTATRATSEHDPDDDFDYDDHSLGI